MSQAWWPQVPAEVRLGAVLPVAASLLSLLWPPTSFSGVQIVSTAVAAALAVGVVAHRRAAWRVMVVIVSLWTVGDLLIAITDAPLGALLFVIDAAALWFLTRQAARMWVATRSVTSAAGKSG